MSDARYQTRDYHDTCMNSGLSCYCSCWCHETRNYHASHCVVTWLVTLGCIFTIMTHEIMCGMGLAKITTNLVCICRRSCNRHGTQLSWPCAWLWYLRFKVWRDKRWQFSQCVICLCLSGVHFVSRIIALCFSPLNKLFEYGLKRAGVTQTI